MEPTTLEALALADDRDAALAHLVPGTEDHDWWRSIRLQNLGDLDAVDPILARWRSLHGDTGRRAALEQRQLLLRADRDLPARASELCRTFGVRFDHRAEIEAASVHEPTALDPAVLDPQRLLDEALLRDPSLGTVTDDALPLLLHGPLSAAVRRTLLGRLSRGGFPGLVDAIAADLREKSSEGFGSLRVHQKLVTDELVALADRVPALREHRAWVLAMLGRQRPPFHVDAEFDLRARAAWLDALWAQVRDLPPSFRSLQVHVLYHRLVVDLRTGVVDPARLLAYLHLPRHTGYARWPGERELGTLTEDFSSATGLSAVGDDEPVVRALLAQLLATEEADAFRPTVDGAWLDRLLAETRLLAGDPDVERWTTILGPAATTALRDRIDLDLLPTTPRIFGRDAPVFLDVALKNPGRLRIRVFRVDTAAHVRVRGTDVPLGIDLDGLSPGHEDVREPTLPPIRRTVERIAVPACDRPGTWVVELVGNGRASRALVRKGDLRAVTRVTAGGLAVRILDETGAPCPEATLQLGGRLFRPREDGAIPLPFSTRRGDTDVLLCDGELAVPATVSLPAERYVLSAAFWLDRQSLASGRDAVGVLRLDLTVDGAPIPPAVLEEAWVDLTVRDRTGTTAVRREALTLEDGVDPTVVPVPAHLETLAIAVGGRVRVVSEQRTAELGHTVQIDVSTMSATTATDALYLGPSDDGWSLYRLGTNGEPRVGTTVHLSLRHVLLAQPIELALATDRDGRIRLGGLPGIRELTATAGGVPQTFEIGARPPQPRPVIHAREGDEVLVPVPVGVDGAPLPAHLWSVVELLGGLPAVDRSAAASSEPGLLRLRGLPAGEHRVTLPGTPVTVRILPRVAGEWVALPDVSVEIPPPAPVLAAVAVDPKGVTVTVTVANAGPDTRLCVLATTFWPAPASSPDLAIRVRLPQTRPHRLRTTETVSGRDLGDEARYVLDRRHQPRRPGTMLERPPLLLNPWALRTTHTAVQDAREGGSWASGAAAPAASADFSRSASGMRGGGGRQQARVADPAYAAWDFLGAPPVVLVGLRPDADGRIRIARDVLGEARVVQIVLVDPAGTATRTVALPFRPLQVRDLRLPAALPADRHVREDRRLVPTPAGTELAIDDRATSRLALVDTVGKLYRALCALGQDADLAAWEFLPRWGALSRDERLALYARHACHELSLFVYFKDRPLFEDVVRPYVANKLHPTFVDDFLVGRDLSPFLDPWRLGQLNAIELALLARRMPAARPSIARLLGDRVALVPADPERDDALVNTLLAGGALAGDGAALDSLSEQAADTLSATLDDDAEEPSNAQKQAMRAAPAPPMRKRMSRDALDRRDREESAPLFRSADQTREWAEHAWWHTRIEDQGPEHVRASRLWRDLALHAEGPFLSTHVGDAAASFAASVCALAVLELPFAAEPSPVAVRGRGASIRAGSHLLAALTGIAPVMGPPTGEVVVGQTTVRTDDRWEWDGAEQREKVVTGERLTAVAYTDRIVVTNPTSRLQRLAVLVQIPAGAVPIAGSVATRTLQVALGPYATESLEVSYTFPAEGTFARYGAQVVRGDVLVAAIPSETLAVVRVPTVIDTGSWAHVSQRGSLDEVLGYLSERNLGRVDLPRIAWRLRDRVAYERITAVLAARHLYDDVLWSYALLHHDRARTGEWLAHQDLGALGPLRTGLVTIDPVERRLYQHLEYAPLVNARAHRLGAQPTVLNDGLAEQWRVFLERVATEPAPTSDDRLAAAHQLFVMDRPEDALRELARVDPGDTRARLQHDYLVAWAAAATGDLVTARARSTPHVAHPVDRWRHRFAAVVAMLDEVEGIGGTPSPDPDSRDARMGALAAQQPALDAGVEDGHLLLVHQNLASATLRFHRMDIELLFSRQPFLAAAGDRFAFVDPGATVELTLDPAGRTRVALPAELRRTNVVIEVVAGAVRQTVTWLAHDLALTVAAPYGQLQVRRASTGVPLPAAYVKVYGRSANGAVQFYKDGYTDLRGRLDYATLSTDDLDRVERFALLVVHDDAGAMVTEAEPPTR